MNVTRATHYRVLPGLIAVAVLGCSLTVAQDKKTTSSKTADAKPEAFGGSYASLLPPQKRLIDGYFQRASEALGKKIEPETAYDNLRLSVRSTFDAVTHALSRQQLTGKDGKKYGTALDLVDIVEGVAGERKGAGGDEQFRIYVLLKPDAYDVLTKVKEFERKGDNTVYHKGYPICFRSMPAVPSIQFSLTRDHMRADVDVDYRSSKFPKALVNGHLTASNSDVRAGNNLERHDSRWAGLSGWWQNLFGLPQIKAKADKSWSEGTVAVAPNADPDQLTHDLLTVWLVDQNLGPASAYFSRQVYPCVETHARKQGHKVAQGIGQFLLLMELANGAKVVGPVDKLSSVVSAPQNPYDQLKPVKNKYDSEFLLLKVPDDQADEFRCAAAKEKRAEANKGESGDYFASLVRIKPPKSAEVVLVLLWEKESKKYRVVSARVIDAGEPGLAEQVGKPKVASAETPMPTVDGDPTFNATLQNFFTTWLMQNNAAKATSFFTPGSYACLPPEKASQGAKALTEAMSTVRTSVGTRKSLQDYLQPVVPDDPKLKRVIHGNDNAYAIVLVPGAEAQSLSCSKTKKLPSEGSYYGTVFRFRTTDGNDPATLYVLWANQNSAWKIVAWKVISAS